MDVRDPTGERQATACEDASPIPLQDLQKDKNKETGYNDDQYNPDLQLRVHDTAAIEPPHEASLDTKQQNGRHERLAKILPYFRPYYILDFLDWGSTKIVARTWAKTWVASLLTIIPKSNAWFGQASFLLLIFSLIIPCGNFSITQSIQTGVICMAGSCGAWLVTVVAMAISSKIRGDLPMSYYAKDIISRGLCSSPEDLQCIQRAIFHGYYLNAKCTVIFVIALLMGLTFFIYLKIGTRDVRFAGVAGIITLMITGSYGVYQPAFDPLTLGLTVLKPLGVTFALNVVFCILLFPKTSSFAYIDGHRSILNTLLNMSKLHVDILKNDRPSLSTFERYKQVPETVGAMTAKLKVIDPELFTMTHEISYGRLDRAWAKQLNGLVVRLMHQLQGFEVVYEYIAECRELVNGELAKRRRRQSMGKYEQQQHDYYQKVASEHVTAEELDQLMAVLDTVYTPAMERAGEAFEMCVRWLQDSNEYRAYCIIPSQRRKQQAKQEQNASDIVSKHESLMAVYQSDVHDHEKLQSNIEAQFGHNDPHHRVAIRQACLYGVLVREYIRALDSLMRVMIRVDEQLPRPHFVFPWTNAIKLRLNLDAHNTPYQHHAYTRDPEAAQPKHIGQRIGMVISTAYHWVMGNKLLLTTFRGAAFAVLLTFPAFFHSTAWWFYSNRLIWCSIMVCMSTFPWYGDTMYAWIADCTYTFAGGVLSLVSWYIGNGRGGGNYYGQATMYAVVFVFLVYYRHFSRHYFPLPAILFSVTYVLTTGTSWQDQHSQQPASLGHGWPVVWKRFVTVMVGLTVGCIAGCFPKPFTVKKAIRVNLGTVMTEIGKVHADVSNFAITRARDDPETHLLTGHGRDAMLTRMASISALLSDTRRKCRTTKFEPPLQGTYPLDKYVRLVKLCGDVVLLYRYLYSIFNQVRDTAQIYPMVRAYGWTDTNLTSDMLAVLHMCGSSLVTRAPLPMLTPAQTTVKHLALTPASSMGDLSGEHRFMIAGYCLMQCIYVKIDEMAFITKQLVGEVYDIDQFYYENYNAETQPLMSNV